MSRDDRDRILGAVRRHRVPVAPYPKEAGPWIAYEDPRAQFSDVVTSVGGEVRSVANVASISAELSDLPAYARAQRRASEVAGVDGEWNVVLTDVDDPHQLADLEFALFRGEFAVAENGAIWVTDRNLRQRTAYFITQHLAIVVEADQIVNNMHEAYQRLAFLDNVFGCFISGPSKTADIEQSLVIGAHGARSLTVLIVES